MNVQPKVYKGIEYLELNDLPADQREVLRNSEDVEIIKILINGTVIDDCIQYKHYRAWKGDTINQTPVSTAQPKEVIEKLLLAGSK